MHSRYECIVPLKPSQPIGFSNNLISSQSGFSIKPLRIWCKLHNGADHKLLWSAVYLARECTSSPRPSIFSRTCKQLQMHWISVAKIHHMLLAYYRTLTTSGSLWWWRRTLRSPFPCRRRSAWSSWRQDCRRAAQTLQKIASGNIKADRLQVVTTNLRRLSQVHNCSSVSPLDSLRMRFKMSKWWRWYFS